MGGWIKIKFIFPAMQFDITIHNSTADLVLPLTQWRTMVASLLLAAAAVALAAALAPPPFSAGVILE